MQCYLLLTTRSVVLIFGVAELVLVLDADADADAIFSASLGSKRETRLTHERRTKNELAPPKNVQQASKAQALSLSLSLVFHLKEECTKLKRHLAYLTLIRP